MERDNGSVGDFEPPRLEVMGLRYICNSSARLSLNYFKLIVLEYLLGTSRLYNNQTHWFYSFKRTSKNNSFIVFPHYNCNIFLLPTTSSNSPRCFNWLSFCNTNSAPLNLFPLKVPNVKIPNSFLK